jgi:hypothetical protein
MFMMMSSINEVGLRDKRNPGYEKVNRGKKQKPRKTDLRFRYDFNNMDFFFVWVI